MKLGTDLAQKGQELYKKGPNGLSFGSALKDTFNASCGTIGQSFLRPWKHDSTGKLLLTSPRLASSSWVTQGAQAGLTILPGYLKLISLGALLTMGAWDVGRGLSKTYQAYSTYRGYHLNGSREGILYNLAQGALSGGAGALILATYAFRPLGLFKPFTDGVLKSVPALTAATVASEGMDTFQKLADNSHALTKITMGGVNNPFRDPKNGYVSPLWSMYQTAALDLDNKALGWLGVKRIPFVTPPHGEAPLSYGRMMPT